MNWCYIFIAIEQSQFAHFLIVYLSKLITMVWVQPTINMSDMKIYDDAWQLYL